MGKRLDFYLVENGMIRSRERSKELIKSGQVTINGVTCIKPSFIVLESDIIEITGESIKYAGRGGLKLEYAIREFDIKLDNYVCLDIGASTGGFTDCMIQSGAEKVYAVDVGHDQLAEIMKNNVKVVNIEKTDIRSVSVQFFEYGIDFISVDVSFISLKLILDKVYELLKDNCFAVVLIKPQFEAGKSNINKNGIVKDKKIHINILNGIYFYSINIGFSVKGIVYSPIKGGKGNIEYLMYLRKCNEVSEIIDVSKLVIEAFNNLN